MYALRPLCSLSVLVLSWPLLTLASLLLHSLTTSLFLSRFTRSETGVAVGVEGSVQSVGRVIAPVLGGAVYQAGGYGALGVLSAALTLSGLFVLKMRRERAIEETIVIDKKEL